MSVQYPHRRSASSGNSKSGIYAGWWVSLRAIISLVGGRSGVLWLSGAVADRLDYWRVTGLKRGTMP